MSMQYSPFYMFLSYLQIGTMILSFVLAVIGVIGGVLAIKALLIYIKKNKDPKAAAVSAVQDAAEPPALPEPSAFVPDGAQDTAEKAAAAEEEMAEEVKEEESASETQDSAEK